MIDQHLGGWALDNDCSGTMDKDLTFVLWVGDRRANRIGAVTKRVGNALGGQDFTAWTGHTIAITLD